MTLPVRRLARRIGCGGDRSGQYDGAAAGVRPRAPRSVLLLVAMVLPALVSGGCRHAGVPGTSGEGALVSLGESDPSIRLDMRYAGSHNFVGRPIAGYEAPVCLLTPQAAEALSGVQREVAGFGLTLHVFDCYRPQRAVDDFVGWAAQPGDTVGKWLYPSLEKDRLFPLGYIAERSGHSRGSTVDLTLAAAGESVTERRAIPMTADCRGGEAHETPEVGLEMGTAFDCFDEMSHTAFPAISPEARRNRLLLRLVMEKHGFVNYDREWWHFRLVREPYPESYFDGPVR